MKKDAHNRNLELVYKECINYMDRLPPPLKLLGNQYFEGYSKRRMWAIKGWYLPFWLAERFKIPSSKCRIIALSNVLGGMNVHIIDAVMDTEDFEASNLLSLSNWFFFHHVQLYNKIFRSNSPFWFFMDKYILEWGEAILWERMNHRFQIKDYSDNDLRKLAQKASPIKICCAAVAVLAQKTNLLPKLEKAMDHIYAAIELTDSLIDWKIDLENKNYSIVLTKISRDMNISDYSELNENLINKSFFSTNIIDYVINNSIKQYILAKNIISDLNITKLEEFLDESISRNYLFRKDLYHQLKKKVINILSPEIVQLFTFDKRKPS